MYIYIYTPTPTHTHTHTHTHTLTHTHIFIQVVLQEMRNRQVNGVSKSGRYKSEDTTRLKYTLWGQDKVNLEQWVRKHYSDPHSKNKEKLNEIHQTSILEWYSLNTQQLSKPSSVPEGVVPVKCKMGFGTFTDWTVEKMVKSSDQTRNGQTTGSYLRWICTKDGSFNWTWKWHYTWNT